MDHKTQPYETVPIRDEDPEDARSSTEVDEEQAKTLSTRDRRRWPRESRTRRSRCFAAFQMWRGIIDTALLVIILVLLLLLLRREGGGSPKEVQVGSDGEGPEFTETVIKWNADAAFVPNKTEEFFSKQTLDKWNTLMPANAGWSSAGDAHTFATTSMTHQLHCLFMMGRIYAGITHNMTDRLPKDYHSHFLHCIDYIRQGIMCAGDTALEPHSDKDADDLGPLDGGWNGMHVCKDYGEVIGYLEGQIRDGVRTVLPIDD